LNNINKEYEEKLKNAKLSNGWTDPILSTFHKNDRDLKLNIALTKPNIPTPSKKAKIEETFNL
jgi:hypothetical protein